MPKIETQIAELERKLHKQNRRLLKVEKGIFNVDTLYVGTGRGKIVRIVMVSRPLSNENFTAIEHNPETLSPLDEAGFKIRTNSTTSSGLQQSGPIYIINYFNPNGFQANLNTTFAAVGTSGTETGSGSLYQPSFLNIPSNAQHRFSAYIQDDTAGGDVRLRIMDRTNTLELSRIDNIGTLGFYEYRTFSNLPTGDAIVKLEWCRAAGTGNATIFAGTWTIKPGT